MEKGTAQLQAKIDHQKVKATSAFKKHHLFCLKSRNNRHSAYSSQKEYEGPSEALNVSQSFLTITAYC